MRIEMEISFLDEKSAPAGSPISLRSIRSSSVTDLIASLSDVGVTIDQESSEQDIEYVIRGEGKKSTVPFSLPLGGSARATRYILRGKGVELFLEDFHEIIGTGGNIGGRVYHRGGIRCLINLQARDYQDGERILQIRDVLERVYR